MPSAWPSRLRSGPVTPIDGTPNSQASRTNGHPTGLLVPVESIRRTHSHNRSSSQPLPKLFAKRRSSFNWGKHADEDDAVDEAAAQALAGLIPPSPARADSGKQYSNDTPLAQRACMCCAQKVRIPIHLGVFRCTSCLTINDLQARQVTKDSVTEAKDRTRDRGRLVTEEESKPMMPLSIERTRALVDACLATFFEGKSAERSKRSPKIDQSYFPVPTEHSSTARNESRAQSADAPPRSSFEAFPEVVNGSNVSTPDEAPSASIKSVADIDYLTYSPPGSGFRRTSQDDTHTPKALAREASHRLPRKPVPASASRMQPPVLNAHAAARARIPYSPAGPVVSAPRPKMSSPATPEQRPSGERFERAKRIFLPLEEYCSEVYGRFEAINASFSTFKPRFLGRTHSESALRTPPPESMDENRPTEVVDTIPQIDAKTLLLGDFAENGDWWTGRMERSTSRRAQGGQEKPRRDRLGVNQKSPYIDWAKVDRWYDTVRVPDHILQENVRRADPTTSPGNHTAYLDAELRADLDVARTHVERSLFKITENLLRRPGRPLKDPQDIRFLLIILSNPLLYPAHVQARKFAHRGLGSTSVGSRRPSASLMQVQGPGKHAGILKRCFGLLAGSSETCHRFMISWFSRMPESRFLDLVDVVSSFVSYRLSKRKTAPRKGSYVDDNGLIPDLSGSAMRTSTQLQRAAGLSGGVKNSDDNQPGNTDYSEDWQLVAAAKVMTLLFAANNQWHLSEVPSDDKRPRSKLHGQLLPTSDFYNTLLDYQDVIADFKAWESKKEKLSFCQYPFFLSMAAKIKILEYDARRQQETKARETYFNNVISGRVQGVNLQLTVRRECVVDDSLKRISEITGGTSGDLKKGLKIHFAGEEGVDAGGLRKEWFLLLVRDIFDPDHGLFLYDDDSHLCYFNPHSFETSDQYYLVGVLLGLAIYNSTILDVPLPPFAFRKLLASAPPTSSSRQPIFYTLDDLSEYRPRLASGLRQLLSFEGDVEQTYCWTFAVPTERYGSVTTHELIPNGDAQPVTNANRHEFVALYVRHLLDTAVARQFEPFKRGFFTVCAGNALSLFRAEEIELLIRGAEESRIDVDALRGVAVYENFREPENRDVVIRDQVEDRVERVKWFWEFFGAADPVLQRRVLQFVTGSDRVPATGAAGLALRVVAGGDGTGTGEGEDSRYPIARTCFNMIVLWGWKSRERLEEMVRGAVEGSEGFGLK